MTPEARIGAAVEILDRVLAGEAAERALTTWARGSRFAGSRDRAAIRDHVYDALRRRRSALALSGQAAPSGRALMIGLLRDAGTDPTTIFSGQGYAPAHLTGDEAAALAAAPSAAALPEAVALDLPDWLVAPLKARLGADFHAAMEAMRHRAPIFLRVNAARGDRDDAMAALAAEGIATRPSVLAAGALEVTDGAARIKSSQAYLTGLVELQDAASQAAVEALPLQAGLRALDYCAGGGGKVLAMAARVRGSWFAHDADSRRMADLPARAERAGVAVRRLTTAAIPGEAPFDLVLTDVPCTGSGTWRRTPQAKWTLRPERLAALNRTQDEILAEAQNFVRPGGLLAYMTCSLLDSENAERIAAFLARFADFTLELERRFSPLDGGDGFYLACLRRR
ncbi:RsmB/NOP family class I SAM-dependent RNA methyltransferase [Albidovulum sediminicola]|uniref:RsmB/NOP family class I SAM-dependent RNA methyltransferase n=1 Tax=Albidovulum sediminicola TaxID=2984331 RepID=A0ABT2YZK6_9RHOB|nr:RsmB/NOP family class I SAM-dependent RNA methyltransferase [Defluviimonas sp. WL0075]MCV2864311.1 RsmB/NOP family class I SAM-dependent RNA methyltransferase [Defluviimonas sp. WL0075]